MGWPLGWTSEGPVFDDTLSISPDQWAHEPAGVSRLGRATKDARTRISILGNGWVPQVVALVVERIRQGGTVHP